LCGKVMVSEPPVETSRDADPGLPLRLGIDSAIDGGFVS
jgi:hypothetical protein